MVHSLGCHSRYIIHFIIPVTKSKASITTRKSEEKDAGLQDDVPLEVPASMISKIMLLKYP
jgi:hypothetical protein